MKQIPVLLAFIILIFSCQDKEQIISKIIEVNYKDVQTVELSKDFTLFQICPLETTVANLIGQIKKIEIYKSEFYILDEANNCIFHHDSTGKFIEKLEKIGRGPEEYMRITDFKVNDNGIFLIDYLQQAILHYNHEMQFVQKIRFDFYASEFQMQPESFFIYSERTNTKNDYCFYQTDKRGKILKSFVKRDVIDHREYNFQFSNVFCYNSDSLFSPRYSNYIYSLNDKSVGYKLNFKDKTFPEEKLCIEDYDVYDPQFAFIVREHIYQQDNILIISYCTDQKRNFVHYNMGTNQTEFNGNYINDLLPDFRFFPQWQKGKYWIDCIDSYGLIQGYPKLKETIEQLKNIKDTDNPMLVIYKMKDKQ